MGGIQEIDLAMRTSLAAGKIYCCRCKPASFFLLSRLANALANTNLEVSLPKDTETASRFSNPICLNIKCLNPEPSSTQYLPFQVCTTIIRQCCWVIFSFLCSCFFFLPFILFPFNLSVFSFVFLPLYIALRGIF